MQDHTWQIPPQKASPALKKKIVQDWYQFFPELKMSNKVNFSKFIGPLKLSCGLQFSSDREQYIPGFSVHNFNESLDFISATLNSDLRTIRTNAPNWLNVKWHEKNYPEAVERLRSQAYLPYEGPISLEQVIIAYRKYTLNNPYSQMLTEAQDPIMLAVWAGDEEIAKQAFDDGIFIFKSWPEGLQNSYGGFEKWSEQMQAIMADPESLRQTTRERIAFHKLSQIPYQDFSDTAYTEKLTDIYVHEFRKK